MLTLKQVKSIAGFNKNKYLNFLDISNKNVTVTDLSTVVKLTNASDLPDGRYLISTLSEYSKPLEDREFPMLDNVGVECLRAVGIDDLLKVSKHASKDETRLHLMTVCFQDKNIVATSGYTLKYLNVESNGAKKDYLLPADSIEVLAKLCKLFKIKNITIQFGDSWAVASREGFEWRARLVKHDFIKWRFVVPSKWQKTLKVSNWIDFKSIKPLMDKFKGYPSTIEVVGSDIIFAVPETDIKIKIGESEHEGLRLGFNASYLDLSSEGLKSFEIEVNDSVSPCLVNKCIIAPLKV